MKELKLCFICSEFSDLECPGCRRLLCLSCFVAHSKQCYEQHKNTSEQQEEKRCTACGRYASVKPLVHCSDCSLEFCRSCLYAHKKTHAEQAELCPQCNASIDLKNYTVCPQCKKRFHIPCYEHVHRFEEQKKTQEHKKQEHTQQDPSTNNFCVNCGKPKAWGGNFSTCPLCNAPVCYGCSTKHMHDHASTRYHCCMCNKPTTTQCDECQKPFCADCFPLHNRMFHVYYQSPGVRWEYGSRINRDDSKIEYNPDFLEEMQRAANQARRMQEEAARKKAEAEAARRFEEAMRDQEYRRRQSYTHTTTGVPRATADAFALLRLSTRATVQEVKRAFRRSAKSAHPDTGGSKEQFVKLNNAYELALKHAERNER